MGKSTDGKRMIWNIIIIVVFIAVLFTVRILWMNFFSDEEKVYIENGEIDLTNYEFLEKEPLELQGEWNFYPYELIDKLPEDDTLEHTTISVPGDWSEKLNPDKPENSYGYGTYHLRLYVNPEMKDLSYSMRMASVRSASRMYSDSYLIGQSGKVSEDPKSYTAFNKPYTTSSIRPNDDGMIDVFVQVSNFTEPRRSGIIRSVTFGSEAKINERVQLSTMIQVMTGTVFLVHAIFAFIIYLIGIRKKEFLYFSLALFAMMTITLGAGDEKVTLALFPLNYIVTYKLSMVIFGVLALAIVKVLAKEINQIHQKIVPIFTWITILFVLYSIIAPIETLATADFITFSMVIVAVMLAIVSLMYSRRTIAGGIWLVLALFAITNHFIWYGISLYTGVKTVYYPFDLIIVVICLGGVWLKHYYEMNVSSQQQAERLAKADSEKDLFLANTSHELRSPLHSILNMSNAVLKREQHSLKSDSVEDLEMVLTISRRMTIQLNDLLEMTRLDGRKPTLHMKEVSFPGVVESVVHMLEYLIVRKPIFIDNQLKQDFPYVIGDENRIIQIMYNLIHNAIKYTPEGKITIRGTVERDVARISIIDTGKGIDEETLSYLFLPYRQGKQESYTEGGFGLGLYIAKQLIEYQDGKIEVHSEVGKGSTFTVTFPLANKQSLLKDEKLLETTVMEENTETFQSSLHSLETEEFELLEDEKNKDEVLPNILVVDDDPVNLRVIEVILQNEQYKITTATSGREVLELIDKQEYDLIISDVTMPHMSGLELTKNVRTRFTMADLPVLLLTSRDRIRDIQYGFEAGANDYVTKPIEAEELKSRVKALTDVKRAAREALYLETAFLQAQIQPHFIFNVINSIFALSEIDIQQMQKLLEAFSDVLRSKFQFRDIKNFVDIKEELHLIESYLYIEKIRFRDRVNVEWNIDENVDIQIPSITIQPLVENAILHGITKKRAGGTITISVIDNQNDVEIIVEDDGTGMSKDRLKKLRNQERISDSGVGIYNTNLRLIRTYGEGLHIESEEGKGTKVSFKIPKDKKQP